MAQITKYHLLIFLIGISSNVKAQKPNYESSLLIIRNINIVDVTTGKILHKQDVVVKDQLIIFIGKSFTESVSTNPKYIDGKRKYLCPGLWDMHFHLCWDKNNDTFLFPALLKNGITGIRDMGGDLKIMNSFKAESQSFKPDIYGAGPMIDGNPPVYFDFSMPVDDKTNITVLLDSLKNSGADFFKTYSLIKEKQLRDISTFCTKYNIQFAGHLSEYIEPEISISLGQKSIEHLNRLDIIWEDNKNRLDSIANLMKTNHTFLCPTLITYQLKTKVRDTSIVNRTYSKYISASLLSEWQTAWGKRMTRHTKLADWEGLNKTFQSQMQLVNHLHKMGVMILAGSDFAGMAYVYPGISLHQELKLLVQAGLSNYEALKTATINPSIFMSKQNFYGSVAVGKYADMLILEKNPFDNIENLKTTTFVIVKGEIFKGQK
ncbi:MAG: amidohydrolase family protein [Saprospiraceae bacterium]|nr:amidohydrolase family protein [Saprospiraceae bacterium]